MAMKKRERRSKLPLTLNIRLAECQLELWSKAARNLRITLSEYIRRSCNKCSGMKHDEFPKQ